MELGCTPLPAKRIIHDATIVGGGGNTEGPDLYFMKESKAAR
jgi:hypothetical protein